MTIFSSVRCSVTSCPFNLGARGLTCDWLRNGCGRCHHPIFKEAWALAHELAEAQEPAARPLSLTGRAAAASTPMDAARARQMILELEVTNV